ncbi:regulation of nuclear pre-mRNA domain-containing protein 1A-like [Microplitis mediator]|uniref:regulation of nuclear pre-mRNA domain-containing protein 1A-like n=1 Tax=Microplitis mediator TaxID=375433 RepID=UPI0025557061|nr:regulation of nuclear pre-mRNA domain-containing protein 1A-like [Microplitis mediator]
MKLFCHFNEANLREKLIKMNASQASIDALYKYIVHHKQKTKLIIGVWGSEMYKARPCQKLYYMLLANKIIQDAEQCAPELVAAFKRCLLPIFYHLKNSREDEYFRNGISVILRGWAAKGICDDVLSACKVIFNDLHISGR